MHHRTSPLLCRQTTSRPFEAIERHLLDEQELPTVADAAKTLTFTSLSLIQILLTFGGGSWIIDHFSHTLDCFALEKSEQMLSSLTGGISAPKPHVLTPDVRMKTL
ncbi:hypothetical protein L2E82_51649 [Cichorium intybus]|nr:hypothetical protein L2E82_51649 [Cichorium intybus]